MKRKNDMNLWWGMWWLAVAVFMAGWFCFLTGCGAKEKPKETGRFEIVSKQVEIVGDIVVMQDSETGREYLYIDSYQAVALAVMPEEAEPQVVETVATVAKNATVTQEMPAEVEESPLESMGTFKVTAYCACEKCCGKTPDDPWYGITATGTKAKEGRTIAVDPKVIPYGTVVYFEGPDGLVSGYVAEDCGGAIKGNDIDLYFDSHAEALQWGVRDLEVFQYEEGAE